MRVPYNLRLVTFLGALFLLAAPLFSQQDSAWERKLVIPEDNPMTPEKIKLGSQLFSAFSKAFCLAEL